MLHRFSLVHSCVFCQRYFFTSSLCFFFSQKVKKSNFIWWISFLLFWWVFIPYFLFFLLVLFWYNFITPCYNNLLQTARDLAYKEIFTLQKMQTDVTGHVHPIYHFSLGRFLWDPGRLSKPSLSTPYFHEGMLIILLIFLIYYISRMIFLWSFFWCLPLILSVK